MVHRIITSTPKVNKVSVATQTTEASAGLSIRSSRSNWPLLLRCATVSGRCHCRDQHPRSAVSIGSSRRHPLARRRRRRIETAGRGGCPRARENPERMELTGDTCGRSGRSADLLSQVQDDARRRRSGMGSRSPTPRWRQHGQRRGVKLRMRSDMTQENEHIKRLIAEALTIARHELRERRRRSLP
jgi:hypothetical protein